MYEGKIEISSFSFHSIGESGVWKIEPTVDISNIGNFNIENGLYSEGKLRSQVGNGGTPEISNSRKPQASLERGWWD